MSPLATEPGGVLAPYRAILELAERELELATSGDLDDLEPLAAEWAALTAGLPERPPRQAQALIAQASALQRRARGELIRRRQEVLEDLAKVAQASRAGRGYTPQTRPRWQLDRSA